MRDAQIVDADAPVSFVELEDQPILDRAAQWIRGHIGFGGGGQEFG